MPEFIESRARLRAGLAFVYALFIVYASLSPFSGWREQGLHFGEVLAQPLLSNYTAFDVTLNLLAYLPLGLLLGLTLRVRLGVLNSLWCSCLLGIALSASMEFLQMYLPTRTSSSLDLLANAGGALIGALLALSITAWTRFYNGLIVWRDNTFLHGKKVDFGLVLLALWMFGQTNPSLPMLGNVFISAAAHQPFAASIAPPFDLWECAAVLLNLLMLGTLLLTILRRPVSTIPALLLILACVAVLKFITAAVLLKSSAMLLWVNSEAMLGILLGGLLLWLAQPYGQIVRLGSAYTVAYLVVAHLILDSTPSAAMSVYHWHYGHLLNYNGLAQTITLVFPALLLLHLFRLRDV